MDFLVYLCLLMYHWMKFHFSCLKLFITAYCFTSIIDQALNEKMTETDRHKQRNIDKMNVVMVNLVIVTRDICKQQSIVSNEIRIWSSEKNA